MGQYKAKPFKSVIDGKLRYGKTDRKRIYVHYEPSRSRAGIADETILIPVTVNGKRIKRRFSRMSDYIEL